MTKHSFHNMHTIISAFWLAESMLIYPKQCKKNKKNSHVKLVIFNQWSYCRQSTWTVMKIKRTKQKTKKQKTDSMAEIIVCILSTSNHKISHAIFEINEHSYIWPQIAQALCSFIPNYTRNYVITYSRYGTGSSNYFLPWTIYDANNAAVLSEHFNLHAKHSNQ